MFDDILKFEQALAKFTGAPYAIMTDCCTHAIELCLRHDAVAQTDFPAYTYLSIPMTMHKLGIEYTFRDEQWTGEYQFGKTRIWDSARRLERDMHRPGQLQCLSFGHSKPLQVGRGGAILVDDIEDYDALIQMRYDGRMLGTVPWQNQQVFRVGYHYRPTIEEAKLAARLLRKYQTTAPIHVEYPDLRAITITS